MAPSDMLMSCMHKWQPCHSSSELENMGTRSSACEYCLGPVQGLGDGDEDQLEEYELSD